jgi:hypothetical protein
MAVQWRLIDGRKKNVCEGDSGQEGCAEEACRQKARPRKESGVGKEGPCGADQARCSAPRT